MNINYTIIIPHKNTPHLLRKCLSSIPKRDDVQIIVIDDNSDSELSILDELIAEKKDCVEFIRLNKEESASAGRARNIGIKKAKGRWLLFADADDYFSENLNTFLEYYKDIEHIDVIYFDAQVVDEKGITTVFTMTKYITNFLNNKKYSKEVIKFELWTPWIRMVRKELVLKNNIQFEERAIGNDMLFSLTCGKLASSMEVYNKVLYYYYKPSEGSLTSKYYTKERIADQIELKVKLNCFYDDINYKFKHPILYAGIYSKYPKEYFKLVFKVLKEHNISIYSDIKSIFTRLFARMFRII
ncbi:MAG: glycosyltransferase family 2 protein [Phocaeicola sp.]